MRHPNPQETDQSGGRFQISPWEKAGKFQEDAARSKRCNKPLSAVYCLLKLIGFAPAISFEWKTLAPGKRCSRSMAWRIRRKKCCYKELSLDKIAALRDQVLTSSRGLILSG